MRMRSTVIHSYFIIYIENIQCFVVEYGSHFTSEDYFIFSRMRDTGENIKKKWLMSDFLFISFSPVFVFSVLAVPCWSYSKEYCAVNIDP